jgi:hypothetical protein
MKKVAATLPGGFVIADHDLSRTGQNTAEAIGWPYFMSEAVGDFNDLHQSIGLFKCSQALDKIFRKEKA